jgi:hypothetical protein
MVTNEIVKSRPQVALRVALELGFYRNIVTKEVIPFTVTFIVSLCPL